MGLGSYDRQQEPGNRKCRADSTPGARDGTLRQRVLRWKRLARL
jgi:hypothetical protein